MMTPLYLDHARFGLAPTRVRQALASFAEFSAREGLSSRIEELLSQGFSSWTGTHQRLYGGLCDWKGTEGLRTTLGRLLAPNTQGEVLLAGRTSQLMRLMARFLFRRCERVLVTDLEWPGYLEILEEERDRTGRELFTVPLRSAVLFDKLPAAWVVNQVASHYRENGCDGAFLSVVSFHGIHLPVSRIVSAIRAGDSARCVVADASQAFGHFPPGDDLAACDMVLTGCHKWPGAFLPLGIASVGGSGGEVELPAAEMVCRRELDDPLLSFLAELDTGRPWPFGETVGLAPLFTAQAAIAEMEGVAAPSESFRRRCENVVAATDASFGTGWTPICIQPSVRCGMLMLRAAGQEGRMAPARAIRERFLRDGVVLSSYDRGFIRLSMPTTNLRGLQLDRLRRALRRTVLAGRAWVGFSPGESVVETNSGARGRSTHGG